jgi:hypothetical protein
MFRSIFRAIFDSFIKYVSRHSYVDGQNTTNHDTQQDTNNKDSHEKKERHF